MGSETRHSMKYAAVLFGIVGAAIGLNLSVMDLAKPAANEAAPAAESVDTGEPRADLVMGDPAADAPASEPAAIGVAPGAASTTDAEAAARDAWIIPGRTEFLHYGFDGIAADIVIAYHDGQRLELWSVTPEIGWASRVGAASARQITLSFERPDGQPGGATFQIVRNGGEFLVTKTVNA